VKADIWEAIEGIRAGGDVRVLALGNPTIASGPFHDAFTSHRDGWCLFTIGALNTPNLDGLGLNELLALPDSALDECARPYLVTRRWVREKYTEWGPDHPLWEARVLGQFPTQAEDALISLAWLEDAGRPSARAASRSPST
jgi:phage terminase large subunit